ncbi:alpha/beta fold hydrolase [Duganella ginsengisoli]|uniref:Alpha/beta fold hydrolase n=2 Tax=Pseudoduganella ginsengisoli TaxID=1462440 RepID=A0A6L6Q5Z3_9BURK|nr:alpha/beta fold hydrolase [Pseudoduganella ginsengisoli]MTW04824.1 alpha/beta fold hydrolase [Pseudoduganella ginsengisoli]
MAQAFDPHVHAAWAKFCQTLSPESVRLAAVDWASHLALSPGRQLDLAWLAWQEAVELAATIMQPSSEVTPSRDRRFAAAEWNNWPFHVWRKAFLLRQNWWEQAVRGVWGVSQHHEDVLSFLARQWLDITSPGNLWCTNPTVLQRTAGLWGANFAQGAQALAADVLRKLQNGPLPGLERYTPGQQVAVTPGKVVLRNALMELIQYSPATGQVHPEPVLLVPAWIMKYYILDLSPHNSLIRHLVEEGHTVFCVSWKNPDVSDRELGMDDYLKRGMFEALDALANIVPDAHVHVAGYCLGGTLAAIGAAALSRNGGNRLKSLTLFAAQTDFSEPGELGLFIDESQVSLIEAQLAETGYLKAEQMAGAFQMLRSYDLLWSRMINQYLLGEATELNDLMAWNLDTTRMPARMHSQYLRWLFLEDRLSEGRYPVDGRPVSLNDITLPVFCVGTETDHVSPWRSVYKLHYLTNTDLTFVLTSGGHNAGIISEPGHPHRHYRLGTRLQGMPYTDPDAWFGAVPEQQGSWWPAWLAWLQAHSGAPVTPPAMGSAAYPVLGDAPGQYVLVK